MRYDEEHKRKTRARILKTAARAIRAQGPHRVGVAAMMRKAGLTHGGFYAHFDSKEAMVSAAIDRMFDESHARWIAETELRAPADGLRAYIDVYLSPAHRDARSVGCPVAALLADLPRLTPACRRTFASGLRQLTNSFAKHLAKLGHADAESLASSAISEMVGALALARGEPDRARSAAHLAATRRLLKRRLGLEKRK
jgi:TetR/AcrR family transcriptional repressor of nem operon